MVTPRTRTQELIDEERQTRNLSRAIRNATQPTDYFLGTQVNPHAVAREREQIRQAVESFHRFNEDTRDRALLLADSQRLRRIYFWGATALLLVVSPLTVVGSLLAGRWIDVIWWSILLFIGLVVVPLYALRMYFIWARSHWYRWIGRGVSDELVYDESFKVEVSLPQPPAQPAGDDVEVTVDEPENARPFNPGPSTSVMEPNHQDQFVTTAKEATKAISRPANWVGRLSIAVLLLLHLVGIVVGSFVFIVVGAVVSIIVQAGPDATNSIMGIFLLLGAAAPGLLLWRARRLSDPNRAGA